jgi:hypothetical protein
MSGHKFGTFVYRTRGHSDAQEIPADGRVMGRHSYVGEVDGVFRLVRANLFVGSLATRRSKQGS